MRTITRREQIYEVQRPCRNSLQSTIHLCGVGALGSNLAVNLARTGVGSLTLIDCDRVDESNVGTQTYSHN